MALLVGRRIEVQAGFDDRTFKRLVCCRVLRRNLHAVEACPQFLRQYADIGFAKQVAVVARNILNLNSSRRQSSPTQQLISSIKNAAIYAAENGEASGIHLWPIKRPSNPVDIFQTADALWQRTVNFLEEAEHLIRKQSRYRVLNVLPTFS